MITEKGWRCGNREFVSVEDGDTVTLYDLDMDSKLELQGKTVEEALKARVPGKVPVDSPHTLAVWQAIR